MSTKRAVLETKCKENAKKHFVNLKLDTNIVNYHYYHHF